jgi:hypothetical protein
MDGVDDFIGMIGLENALEAFIGMLSGNSFGKLLVRLERRAINVQRIQLGENSSSILVA